MLSDPLQSSFYLKFLEKEHADDHFLFFREVEKFKKEYDRSKRLAEAKEIFAKFLEVGGEKQVFVPVLILKEVRASLKNEEAPISLFKAAQFEILMAMKYDSFARFCNSMFYELMCKGIENQAILVDSLVFDTFVALVQNEDPRAWKKKVTKEGQEIWNWITSQTSQRSVVTKSRMTFQCNAKKVLARAFSGDGDASLYDPICTNVRCLYVFDDNFKIFKVCYNMDGVEVFEVVAQVKREMKNGCICIVERSVNWPEFDERNRLVKEDSKKKSEVSLAGYYIEPQTEQTCVITKYDSFSFDEKMKMKSLSRFAKSRSEGLYQLSLYVNK